MKAEPELYVVTVQRMQHFKSLLREKKLQLNRKEVVGEKTEEKQIDFSLTAVMQYNRLIAMNLTVVVFVDSLPNGNSFISFSALNS